VTTQSSTPDFRRAATREAAYLTGFLFFGLALLPVLIYFVGQLVFGDYGGLGYGDFYGTLSQKIRSGDWVAWFLVLSPYLGWQVVRGILLAWRYVGQRG